MTADAFTGTGRLLRLALRRDRFQLPAWLLALAGLQYVSATSVLGLYPTTDDLVSIARTSGTNAVALATNGIVSGASAGAVVASQTVLITATAAAFMSTLLVVRHTRQNEETGRAELVSASVVGRYAPLTAALVAAVGANVALAVVSAVALVTAGLPVAGSGVVGAAVGACGIAFAGVAALVAQITDSARAANGLAATAIGTAFGLRAIGDIASTTADDGLRVVSGWPSWCSPIGWAQQTRPYDADAWWLSGISIGFAIVACGAAFRILEHRDVGAGLFTARAGPANAAAWMLSPIGLVWRLQRSTLTAWILGVAALGTTYGAVANDIDDMVGTSGQASDFFEQMSGITDLTDAFYATVLSIMALAVTGYALQALLLLRSEETTGRTEPILGTPTSRYAWICGHLLVVACGVVVLLAVTGIAIGFGAGLTGGDITADAARLASAAMAYAPAALAVGAVAAAAYGVAPSSASAIAWSLFTACLLLTTLGQLIGLPQAIRNLSPFTHVPKVPAAAVTAAPLVALIAFTFAATAVGIAGFRRRDLVHG